MKKAWPVIRRVLAICFLLFSILGLGLVVSLRRRSIEPPTPLLAQPEVQEVYSRVIPYGGSRDTVMAAYTFEGNIESVTDQLERELRMWVAGPRGPFRADFSRGKPDEFEILTVVNGQLIPTDDGEAPLNHDGRGFVTVFYNRSKSRGESVLGSLFGRYFESKEAAGPQYLLIVPTDKQGGSNGGLGHDQVLWSAFGYREVDKHYVWKVRF